MKRIILILLVLGIVGGGGYYGYTQGWFSGMGTITEVPVTVPDTSGASQEAIAAIPTLQYTETYTHSSGDFSFKYPKDFTVTSVPVEEGEIVTVQNIKTSVGVQIYITPYDGTDKNLTEATIKASIPDLEIKDGQELLIGEGGKDGKGLAFISNNESFGGKSREVWFVYKGSLYQISTYTDLDEFLKGVFATWSFR